MNGQTDICNHRVASLQERKVFGEIPWYIWKINKTILAYIIVQYNKTLENISFNVRYGKHLI